MKITAEDLTQLRACEDQVAVFRDEWPDGAEVTLANCMRAAELGLNIDWAANNLLPASAWEAYKKAKAPAWEAYKKAKARAFYEAAG